MATYWMIGATHGIGRAVAEAALQRGDTVWVSGRDTVALAELEALYPGLAHGLRLDITDEAERLAAVGALRAKAVTLDGVHIYAGAYNPKAVADWDWAACEAIIAVNLTGVLALVHAVLPQLLTQNLPPQLVLCASVAGYVGLPNGQPYSATKAALINFAESLRAEMLARKANSKRYLDVRVVNPGFVKTRMTAKNSFAMPMMVTPEAAATAIWHQLGRPGFEVAFPRGFVWILKALRALPYRVYFVLAQRMGASSAPTR